MSYKNLLINYYKKRGIKNIFVPLDNIAQSSVLSSEEKSLDDIFLGLENCKNCDLSNFRNTIVFGEGNINADLMFVGEAPGEEEDKLGKPFVGKAGVLLNKIIIAMGLSRENVYITNVVKCHPLANRTPTDEEILTCTPNLIKQINAIKPKVIVSLGGPATCFFYDKKIKISSLRGSFFEWNNIKIMPTFHPAYLLRNPNDKKLVWADVQKVMEYLDLNKIN